jgi:hypothetical protein
MPKSVHPIEHCYLQSKTECSVFSPLIRIGILHPLPAGEFVPPPLISCGGDTLTCRRRGGMAPIQTGRQDQRYERGYTDQLDHCSVAEFLDDIHTKVLRVFLLAIHSHLYSFALRFLFL